MSTSLRPLMRVEPILTTGTKGAILWGALAIYCQYTEGRGPSPVALQGHVEVSDRAARTPYGEVWQSAELWLGEERPCG